MKLLGYITIIIHSTNITWKEKNYSTTKISGGQTVRRSKKTELPHMKDPFLCLSRGIHISSILFIYTK